MHSILVNSPDGQQCVIELLDGGSYFDESRVLWDTSVDGDMPQITIGGMVRNGAALVLDDAVLQAYQDKWAAASVPDFVTMRQACIQLELDGLLDDVEVIVAALPKVYQIEWQRASIVKRDNPLVEMVRVQKGMTPAQIDALFVKAAAL